MNTTTMIGQAIEKLEVSGYKTTPARRAVIEALARAPDHLTAPGVVEVVAKQAPTVGRASVYRTLELLGQLGMVQLSSLGGVTTTYLLTAAGHHHHVICRKCRHTVEFEDCWLDDLEKTLSQRLGFRIEGHLVEMYGLCLDCRTQTA